MNIVFIVLELVGVIAFSVSGAMVSVKKNMDLFGVIFLALITAFGGGMLRDTFLGQMPPMLFTNYWMLLAGFLAALAVFIVARCLQERYFKNEDLIERINNIFDALGLGAFAVTGAQVTIDAGHSNLWFLVLMMGMLTAIGGGLLRDLMLREIPFVLNKRIYAIAALVGALVYYLLHLAGLNDLVASLAGILLTFFLRILATVYKWNLPHPLKDKKG